MWAERTVVEYYTVGASRNQSAVKGQSSRKYTALSSESLYWQQNNTKRSYEYKNIKDLWGISEVPKTSRYIYVPFAPHKQQRVQPSGCISGLYCYAKQDRYGIPAPWTFQASCVILIRIAADMSFVFAHLRVVTKKNTRDKRKRREMASAAKSPRIDTGGQSGYVGVWRGQAWTGECCLVYIAHWEWKLHRSTRQKNIAHERFAEKRYCVGRDSSVDIATRYGLDGPGIESWWGRVFPHPSRTALGPTQPPIQWALGKAAGVWRWPLTPV